MNNIMTPTLSSYALSALLLVFYLCYFSPPTHTHTHSNSVRLFLFYRWGKWDTEVVSKFWVAWDSKWGNIEIKHKSNSRVYF